MKKDSASEDEKSSGRASESTSTLNISSSTVTARQEYEKTHLLPGERYCSHHKAGHPIEEFGGNYLTCKASRLKKKTDRAKKSAGRKDAAAEDEDEGTEREASSSKTLPPLPQPKSETIMNVPPHQLSISPNEPRRTPLPIRPESEFKFNASMPYGPGDNKRKRSPMLEPPRQHLGDGGPTRLSLPDLYRDVRPRLQIDDDLRARELSPSTELYRAVDTFKTRVYTDLERMRSENRALMIRNDKLEQDLKQQSRYIQSLHQRITELERFPPHPPPIRDSRPHLPPILDHRSSTR